MARYLVESRGHQGGRNLAQQSVSGLRGQNIYFVVPPTPIFVVIWAVEENLRMRDATKIRNGENSWVGFYTSKWWQSTVVFA
jgi:hypothetical protein